MKKFLITILYSSVLFASERTINVGSFYYTTMPKDSPKETTYELIRGFVATNIIKCTKQKETGNINCWSSTNNSEPKEIPAEESIKIFNNLSKISGQNS